MQRLQSTSAVTFKLTRRTRTSLPLPYEVVCSHWQSQIKAAAAAAAAATAAAAAHAVDSGLLLRKQLTGAVEACQWHNGTGASGDGIFVALPVQVELPVNSIYLGRPLAGRGATGLPHCSGSNASALN